MSAEDLQNLESSSEEEGQQDSNRASQSSSPSTSTAATRKKSIHGSASPSTPRLPSSLAAKMAAMVNRGSNGQANAGGQPIGSSLRSMRQAPLPPNQLKDKMEALSMNDKVKVEENNNPPPNSLAARRGMKLNINGPQSSNDASPAKRRGPPGKLNLSNQDGKADTPFSNFSSIVDPSGKLNFGEGKAILHASGVNFSTGHSFNIKIEDLELQDELGRGAYGSVRKAKHKSTGVVMAIKEIRLELDKTKLAGIAMELDILHRAVKPQIVEFYGAFFVEGCIFYCMEFMDAGSLDKLYSPTFGIPEDILAFVTRDLIIGLQFLKEELQIIHRGECFIKQMIFSNSSV